VAAGAALEVDLLRFLEFHLRHRRRARCHENLRSLGACRRRRAFVLELRDRRRVLGRRGGLLGGRLSLGACRGDVRRRNRATLVSPGVHGIGQRIRDLLVGELGHGGHDGVVLDAVHLDFAGQSEHDDVRRAVRVAEQVVRPGERREGARHAFAVRLVAGIADRVVNLLAVGDLRRKRVRPGDLGLVDLGRSGTRGWLLGPSCRGNGQRAGEPQ
jgi:hypothetical protein